ncbi:hypothetical protein VE00_02655 [Pseudogymnoascus sp. WSF 3629]|jgi:hypothetical protein|nr:hypothetical protein VE00_02655 [Pseudogymnoascus sp. WSF 3629]
MVVPKLEPGSLAAPPPKPAKPIKPVKRAKPRLGFLEKLQRLEKTLGLYSPVCIKLFEYVLFGSLMSIMALMVVSFLLFSMGVAVYLFVEGMKMAVVWLRGG